MYDIADRFNYSSTAMYYISYKRPKLIIEEYKFQVKLVTQLHTSMHGSGEGHTCYIFSRVGNPGVGASKYECFGEVPCDPLFQKAWEMCKFGGYDAVSKYVAAKVDCFFRQKPTRMRKQVDRLTYG